jgi:hypothetical protein
MNFDNHFEITDCFSESIVKRNGLLLDTETNSHNGRIFGCNAFGKIVDKNFSAGSICNEFVYYDKQGGLIHFVKFYDELDEPLIICEFNCQSELIRIYNYKTRQEITIIGEQHD